MATIEEKLTAAFKALRKANYIARKNYWCCSTCGCYEISCRMKKSPKPFAGYVFYHQQDAADLSRKSETYLTWGGDGKAIANILKNSGLTVTWDGDISTRIHVKNNPAF